MQDLNDVMIDELMPDFRNPRIGSAKNRLEALTRIVELQRSKLVNLAQSIATIGLSPIERMFAIKEEDFPDHYVIVEGNRRATALILLSNPTLIETMPVFSKNPDLRKVQARMREIAKSFDRTKLEPLKLVLAPNRESTAAWIQIRHTGEGEGVGVTRWKPVESARFSDPSQPLVLLADILYEEGDLSDLEKELLDDMSWTTFYRFFDSPRLRERLHIDFSDGVIVTSAPRSRVLVAIREIAFRVARGEWDSRKQNSVEDRLAALDDLPTGILPGKETSDDGAGAPDGATEEDRGPDDPRGKAEPGEKKKEREQTEPAPRPRERHPSDKLFKKSEFNVSDKRVSMVFNELCEHSVSKKPSTCGVMLRVFLELSVLTYLSKKGIAINGKGGHQAELYLLIERAYKQLMNDSPELEMPEVLAMIESRTVQGRIKVLHSYVHSRHQFPAPSDLKAMAGELTPFLRAMWARI